MNTNNTDKAKELSDILLEFSSYKTVIQGCSTKTIKEYLLDLATFHSFIWQDVQYLQSESLPKLIYPGQTPSFQIGKDLRNMQILLYASTREKTCGRQSPQTLGHKGALQIHDHKRKTCSLKPGNQHRVAQAQENTAEVSDA